MLFAALALFLPLRISVRERIQRVLSLRLDTEDLADSLGVSTSELLKWISGKLTIEQTDVLEVGIALLEMKISAAARHEQPTTRLAVFSA